MRYSAIPSFVDIVSLPFCLLSLFSVLFVIIFRYLRKALKYMCCSGKQGNADTQRSGLPVPRAGNAVPKYLGILFPRVGDNRTRQGGVPPWCDALRTKQTSLKQEHEYM